MILNRKLGGEGLNLLVKTIMTLKSSCSGLWETCNSGDPPIPIARVHVAVRCSQATTVGEALRTVWTMQWMLRPSQSHNHSVQHIMIRLKWKRRERCEEDSDDGRTLGIQLL